MTDSNQQDQTETPKKKMSLQEAIKQQLENKKNQASNNKSSLNGSTATKKLKSQQSKKANNQARRTGV
ncbi:MAG: hypothetical protein K0S25_2074 [Bacillus sp. (in: firmicutes)]|jgi:hypothetical protein|nr:hypothetical protein [Bacillus sp. (in: firmicutes)]